MKKNDLIRYGIFVLGFIVIFLSAALYVRINPDWKNALNSVNWYESATASENLGQAVIVMSLGWIGIFFGAIGIYKVFKSRKKSK